MQIVFGVADANDPAVAAVRSLEAAFGDRLAIDLVVDGRRRGRNGKVSNLMNMAGHARHEVLVLADSDMVVGRDYLRRLVEALAAPGVGAVTCLYRGVSLPNLWSRLAACWIDTHFLPNVLVGMRLGLAKPCFGSTIALRRDTLDRVGGFAVVKDVLADDYELGAAVRRLGLTVAVPRDLVLGHNCDAGSPGAVLRQELRWARTIRAVDPAGFAGSIVTNPVPLSTLAALWSGFDGPAVAVLLITLALRLVLAARMAGFVGKPLADLWLVPVRDYLAFVVFLASFWPGRIDWRGHRFDLRPDGTLASPETAGS